MNTQSKRTDIMLVDPSNIVIVGDNIREDYGDIGGLAKSIESIGIQVPLKAKKVRGEDKWELVEGHRRFKAVELLISMNKEVGRIPILPYLGNSEDRLLTMLSTGVGGKELTPVEQAEGIKKLTLLNYTPEEIGNKIGKSTPYIYHLLKLADAPKSVKKLISENKIAANVVVELVRDSKNDDEIIDKVNTLISTATALGKTKVTKSTTEPKYSPSKAMKELITRIKGNEQKTDKMTFFLEVYDKLQSSNSLEEVVDMF